MFGICSNDEKINWHFRAAERRRVLISSIVQRIALARLVTHRVRKYFTTADPNQNRDPFPPPAESFHQSLHNPLHPSRTRMLSTILDWVPPSLELEKNSSRILLKKGVRTFLWKHGMFFECNTSCSIILCLFVPFTDEKWRYFGR